MSLRDPERTVFTWHTFSRSYHVSFVITVEKSRSGVKAEILAQHEFSHVLQAFNDADVRFYIQRLFFRDHETSYVVECSGLTDNKALAKEVLSTRSEAP